MKKFIAILLAVMLVVPAVFVLAVSAEGDSNLALNKDYTVSGSGHGKRTTGSWPCNYDANLTDGIAVDELVYSTSTDDPDPAWFSISSDETTVDGANAPDGVCTIIVDLESVSTVSSARIHMINPDTAGIGAPTEINVYLSSDGTDFSKVATKSEFESGDTGFWAEFTFTAQTARYVEFEFVITAAHNFINELEVYGREGAQEPVIVITENNLVPGADAGWTCDPCGSSGIMVVSEEDGAVVFTNTQDSGWPYAEISYDEPFTVDPENTKIVYDFDVSVQTNITFNFGNGSTFPISCDIMDLDFDSGSGDILPGTYTGEIALKDLLGAKANFEGTAFGGENEDGTVSFSGIRIFSSGGNSVTTIRTLKLVTEEEKEGQPTVIKETITVDGDLSDSGWAEDGWTASVIGENAGWQGGSSPDDGAKALEASYQFRTDDEYFYVGVKTNYALTKAPEGSVGNGNSSNVRVWIKADLSDECEAYTHFFDSYVQADGSMGTRAAFNTEKSANAPINADGTEQEKNGVTYKLETSKYQTVMSEDEDGFVAEFAIPLSEINTGADGKALQEKLEKFYVILAVSTEKGNAGSGSSNQCMYIPALGDTGNGPIHITGNGNNKWNAASNNIGLEVVIADIALGEIVVDNGDEPGEQDTTEEEMKRLLGEENEDGAFTVELSAPETYKAGDEITVNATITDIDTDAGIAIVNFTLVYDPSKLTLVYDEEEDFDDDGAYLLPGVVNEKASKWESLTKIDEENGEIEVNYLTTSASAAITEDGAVVIPFVFKVADDAEGKIGLVVPHESVSGSDPNFVKLVGNGSYVIVDVAEEPVQPGDDDKDPETGDNTANIIVLAIIALVAVAGSAVVIKTRR